MSHALADAYVGGLVGYGNASGSALSTTGGVALGATVGFQLIPNLGVAATFIHDSLKSGSVSVGVNQYLLEGNFFSALFFPSGVHFGTVNTSLLGVSTSDMGFGLHTGLDIPLMPGITVGVAGYWTYVTTTNDKHSLLNILVPVKFHL